MGKKKTRQEEVKIWVIPQSSDKDGKQLDAAGIISLRQVFKGLVTRYDVRKKSLHVVCPTMEQHIRLGVVLGKAGVAAQEQTVYLNR